MATLSFLLRHCLRLLGIVSGLVLGGCGNGFFPEMDNKELPHYTLSNDEQAWVTPYRLGQEWRFRNAAGYERRYQVRGLTDRTWPGRPNPQSVIAYYQQEVGARVERVDSAYYQRAEGYKYAATFVLTSAAAYEPQPLALTARLEWGVSPLTLPVAAVNTSQPLPAGMRLLPEVNLGGRTYHNVIEYTSLPPQPDQDLRPWMATRLYYTKEQGVVRFEEAGGLVWDRV
ncbi:hypothetical protein [Hymenobacter sp. B81]|uniref:hypothetical protein n=1 Tax=Hymenobacter sp. B81 TaxID=3344878 RepID=UPI0037DCBC65